VSALAIIAVTAAVLVASIWAIARIVGSLAGHLATAMSQAVAEVFSPPATDTAEPPVSNPVDPLTDGRDLEDWMLPPWERDEPWAPTAPAS
jgi:hypothetical protein